MIGRHRIGMLGQALALGVIPLPLPPPPKPVDMAAAELLIHELQQNGLDPLAIADRAGAEDFVELARAVLAMRQTHLALGNEMTTLQLIAEIDALTRPADPGRIDLQPLYDLGVRQVTIGDERGVQLAHVTLCEGARTLQPCDVLSVRPVLREERLWPSPWQVRPPKSAKKSRDRSGQRAEQAKARASKSRRKARKGWA